MQVTDCFTNMHSPKKKRASSEDVQILSAKERSSVNMFNDKFLILLETQAEDFK